MITIKKMTEMKEKDLYPTLPSVRESPTAQDIELTEIRNDQGHTYRLKVISDIQKFLEEVIKRDAFSKKYFRVSKIISITDSVLAGITFLAETAGAVLLSTGVGAPIALGLGISGAATGAIFIIGNIVGRKTTTKAEKHLKIKILASAKLNTQLVPSS